MYVARSLLSENCVKQWIVQFSAALTPKSGGLVGKCSGAFHRKSGAFLSDLQSCEADSYSSAGEKGAGGDLAPDFGAVRAHTSSGELLYPPADSLLPHGGAGPGLAGGALNQYFCATVLVCRNQNR